MTIQLITDTLMSAKARGSRLFLWGGGLNAKKNYSWNGKVVVAITLSTIKKRLIMFENLGGLIGDLIPFCIFLYLTLVLYGVIKLEKKPEIFDNPPNYYKVIVLLGLIAFAISIILKLIK